MPEQRIVYEVLYGGPRLAWDYEIVRRVEPARAHCYVCGVHIPGAPPPTDDQVRFCRRCAPEVIRACRETAS